MVHMREEDWKYIEHMFDECYLVKEEGNYLVVVSPTPDTQETAMQFFITNGGFQGITVWEDVKKEGERI